MYHLFLGGLHFASPSVSTECLEDGERCAFAAIIDTRFGDNRATSYGGAMFVEYLEAIRFRCSARPIDSDAESLNREDWIGYEKLTSREQFCDAWKNGDDDGDDDGSVVGSFPTRVRLTIEDSDYDVQMRSEHEHIIKRYRASEKLPGMTLQFRDGIDQVTPIRHSPDTTTIPPPSVEFTVANASPQRHEDRITFPNMIGYGPPGTYKLMITFDSEVIEKLTVLIEVRECIIGEMTDPITKMCSDCSSTEYNFNPKQRRCHPCPASGSCATRAIVPAEGYWQSNPCSTHIKKCLTAHACKFERRSDALRGMTIGMASCIMKPGHILKYRRKQCAEARHLSRDVIKILSHFL